MSGALEIELPRRPDRDELLSSLRDHGFDATAVEEDDRFALSVSGSGDRHDAELIEAVERWIAESGAPLVPERMPDGSCLLRPFGD